MNSVVQEAYKHSYLHQVSGSNKLVNTVWYFVRGDLHIPPKNNKRRELLCPPPQNTAMEKIIIKKQCTLLHSKDLGWGLGTRASGSLTGRLNFIPIEIMNRKRGNSVSAASPAHMDGSPSVGPHTCHLFSYPTPQSRTNK